MSLDILLVLRNIPMHTNEGETMFNGWISLRVKDPKRVAAWYTEHRILRLVGGREDIGTQALGSCPNQ